MHLYTPVPFESAADVEAVCASLHISCSDAGVSSVWDGEVIDWKLVRQYAQGGGSVYGLVPNGPKALLYAVARQLIGFRDQLRHAAGMGVDEPAARALVRSLQRDVILASFLALLPAQDPITSLLEADAAALRVARDRMRRTMVAAGGLSAGPTVAWRFSTGSLSERPEQLLCVEPLMALCSGGLGAVRERPVVLNAVPLSQQWLASGGPSGLVVEDPDLVSLVDIVLVETLASLVPNRAPSLGELHAAIACR